MDWKRGLFRFWVLGSALWLLAIGYFATKEFLRPAPFGGNYQYVVQFKEMPGHTDSSKPFYEIAYAPSKGRFPDEFDRLDDAVIEQWDKDGRVVKIEFPDSTFLYLRSDLTENDQTYLADLFWKQRWSRYAKKIASWMSLAFGLPVIALLLGLAIRWVIYGFVHPTSRA
jgi:hypothetical protein